MASKADIATISSLAPSGAFRGLSAIELGVSRRQLAALRRVGVIERMLPDTYRLTSVARSNALDLRAALLWAGDDAAAAGASAGEVDELENVHASMPEIVVPQSHRGRSSKVRIHRTTSMAVVMPRTYRGVRVTGVEATLVTLGTILSPEALEVACEDARRRRLTSMAALRAYLKHHGKSGRPGVAAMRSLLDELDPVHPSRSTLEVKTRRLLVAQGIHDFVREFPLEWNGRTYSFDFVFQRQRVILETNGRRWHDDPSCYEDDQEKWSVPARYGYKIVFATWVKVTREPSRFVTEIRTMLASAA